MKRILLYLWAITCFGGYSNAQQCSLGYDTILVYEDHHIGDFSLYAHVPKMPLGIHLEQKTDQYKIYVQVDAHIDVTKDGTLNNPQNNSSDIEIFLIKNMESGELVYKTENEANPEMTIMVDLLTCYYQHKFSQVNYYLSGQFEVPSRIRFYYVDTL